MKALPIAKGYAYAKTGIPDRALAAAMARSDDFREVDIIIKRHEAEVRLQESASDPAGAARADHMTRPR